MVGMGYRIMDEEELEEIRTALLQGIEEHSSPDIRNLLERLHPADIANLLEGLTPDQRQRLWPELPLELMGEVLIEVPEGVQKSLMETLSPQLLARAILSLDIDEIADLFPDLPDDITARVLFDLDQEARQELDAVLVWPEDTAGGLMNVDTVTIRSNVKLAVVQRYLRLLGELPEYTDQLFVVDQQNHLKGALSLPAILTSDGSDQVADIMESEPVSFSTLVEDEKVATAFERYNLISAAVVDDKNVLLGRITIDDAVDVIRDEADHSIMARAGLDEEDDIFAPVVRTSSKRALWLGVNLVTALLAATVIRSFEATIEQVVALAALMTIIASMGGNAGTQTLTIVIRGMGTGTITSLNVWQVMKKEILVGAFNGLIWAVVVSVITALWYHDILLGVVVAAAMAINLLFAAAAGVALPITVERLGIDPALASGVALTTVTDIVGFFSVLGLAYLFLV